LRPTGAGPVRERGRRRERPGRVCVTSSDALVTPGDTLVTPL
jgi:hypothetical protein